MKKSKLIAPAIGLGTLGLVAGTAYAFMDKGEVKTVSVQKDRPILNTTPTKDFAPNLEVDSVSSFMQAKYAKILNNTFGTTNIKEETTCIKDICKGQKANDLKAGYDNRFQQDTKYTDILNLIEKDKKEGFFPEDGSGNINWEAHGKGIDEIESADD